MQQVVTCLIALAFQYAFDAVQSQQRYRYHATAICLFDCVLQAFAKHAAIRQASQFIMIGLVYQIFFGLLALGNVGNVNVKVVQVCQCMDKAVEHAAVFGVLQ